MSTLPGVSENRTHPSASSTAFEAEEAVRRVLYVGDDSEKRAAWSEALRSAGYSVTAVDSPAAGLSAFLEHRFDGVLLAFHRPYVSSGLVATVMRLFQRGTPLILLSNSGASTQEDLAPFDRVFPKNTAPPVVLGSVHGLIENARRSRLRAVVPFAPRVGGSPEEGQKERRSEVSYEVIRRDQP